MESDAERTHMREVLELMYHRKPKELIDVPGWSNGMTLVLQARGAGFDSLAGDQICRAISSVGRAPRLHRGCRGFKSLIAHHIIFVASYAGRLIDN